ncbi:30S ribosomal protein S1 [Haloimpatiens sp. FM7330]|uniref:30S ribosomal protein S1 n=1 Tax=Haloimpatiens sp. FM7330 TaxID=3298610 RepID=UPI00363BB629
MATDNINEMSMNEMMQQVDASMKKIHKGDLLKGRVISVTDSEVMVNIGYITDGIIPKSEISDKEVDIKEILKQDDEIFVYVVDINDGEGNVLLSKKRADKLKVWKDIEENFKKGTAFDVKVNEVVKGGVTSSINGVRAFIPASQLSISYVKDLNVYLEKTLTVKVIELDQQKGKLVLSAREIEKEQLEMKKKQVWDSLQKGQKRTGTVRKLMKFGAFVDLGGVDGLIHLSDLSWKRVTDPSKVVSVGDVVEVYVLDFDREKNRISLALKDVSKNPWDEVKDKFKVNEVVEGTVVKFTNFGAFVEVEPGVEGLVHISEISEERIAKPSEKLKIGEKVKVKILDIDSQKNRMSLSIKEAIDKPVEDFSKYTDKEDEGVTLGDLFKDKLKDFKVE